MKNLREQNNEKVKEEQRNRKEASMKNLREQDNEKVKEQQRRYKEVSSRKRRAEDSEEMKRDQVKRSRLCLTKKRLENHDRVKVEQNERQQRHREVRNKSERLREFRLATKYNAVFICTMYMLLTENVPFKYSAVLQ